MPEKRKDMALVVLTCIFLYGFLLWAVLKPVDAQSASERRPLAAPPTASWDAVFSGAYMTDFEEYALDQFPLRDKLRTVKALTALYSFRQKDNNGVYLQDGYISKLDYPLDLRSVGYAASRFRYVYEQYLADKDMAVYLSVIPDKNAYMAAEHGAPALDYAGLTAALRDRLDFAQYIDNRRRPVPCQSNGGHPVRRLHPPSGRGPLLWGVLWAGGSAPAGGGAVLPEPRRPGELPGL